MFQADLLAELADLVVAKLHHFVALRTVQVVVRGVAVIVLVGTSVREPKLSQQTRIDEKAQGAIDRRPAYAASRVLQFINQLVGVEMLVGREDVSNQDAPGLGQLLASDFEKLAKLVFRTIRNGDRSQWRGIGHGWLPLAAERVERNRDLTRRADDLSVRILSIGRRGFHPVQERRGRRPSPIA